MKCSTPILIAVLAVGQVATLVSAQEALTPAGKTTVDLSGTWRREYDWYDTRIEEVIRLNLKEDGKVIGTLLRNDAASEIKNGKLKGNELSFSVSNDYQGTAWVTSYTGIIKGDEIDGTVVLQVGDQSWDFGWKPKRSVQMDDVVGTWQIHIESSDGNVLEPTMKISKDGGKYKSVYKSTQGQELDVKDLRVEKNTLKFTVTAEFDGNSVKVDYQGRPYGDKISGSLDYDLGGYTGQAKFTARRKQVATSKSLAKNKDASIEKFRDAGFGLFIHWGPVSQIGKEISWPLVGASKEFRDKYFSLYKTFNPTKFNPKEWARLAKQAGMRYVVFTTQHFNGFNMFDTALSNYNIMNTPYGKDISAQLAKAFRDEGIAIGWYYGVENWHYYYETGAPEINGRYNSTQDLKKFKKPYGTQNLTLLEYELEQMKELLTKYGDIDVMWYDHPAKSAEPLKKRVWELNPDIVIVRSEIPTPEQTVPDKPIKGAWETCMTMGRQWSYKPNDNYKSAVALIDNLVKVRARGGNYLLNVGPKPNGELPAPQVELLKKLGSWNAINGEAIHRVRGWVITNEDNIWFTKKRDANILYAIALEWPGRQLTIKSLRDTKVLSVRMLGLNKEMKWQQSKEGLVIETSDERPSKYAYTFKIVCLHL